MTAILATLAVLVVASGVFSGSTIAMSSVSRAKARALAAEKRRGAEALVALKANPERLLITLLIVDTAVNMAAAALATYAAMRAFGSLGVAAAAAGMTLLVLIFGEIAPRRYAARNADGVALAVAPAVRLLSKLITPLSMPLVALTRLIVPSRSNVPTETEIRNLTEMSHQRGAIDEHEMQLIERAFLLDSTKAWEVMTPRVDIFAWPDDVTLGEVADELPEVPYSRVPIHGGSLDDVTGVLYVRDAYQALARGGRETPIAEHARGAFFVPASISLVQLLAEFRARRVHLGVVVDEHGGTDGIVTLEDVIEELVGEIDDETDRPDQPIRRIGRDEIVVDAGTDLKDINQAFGTELPVQEHRSLNGLLLETLGRVARPGEAVEIGQVEIEVVDAGETHVNRVRMRRLPRMKAE